MSNPLKKSRSINIYERFIRKKPPGVFRVFSSYDPVRLALTRFRKAVHMVQLLLQAVSRIRTRSSLNDNDEQIILNLSRVIKQDLVFDVNSFKRPKEKGLPDEAKRVLRMPSTERTDEFVRIAVAGLIQVIPEYGDFPSNIQKSIAKRCNLDQFEAGRVIIRQGHKADNFYLIVSGITAVLKSERNHLGEHVSTVLAYLNKGKTFGELAIMHQSARNATVRCESDVCVLTIDRDDFLDIFMHVEKGKEPEHISYIRKIDILSQWPISKLPYNLPRICLLTYFRKGVVMCRDSNTSDWLYIIKNGSCKVIKALEVPKKVPFKTRMAMSSAQSLQSLYNPKSKPDLRETEMLPVLFNNQSKVASQRSSGNPNAVKKKVAFADEKSESFIDRKKPKNLANSKHIYIEVQKLFPKDVFGLVNIVFNSVGQSTSVILVSEGAECILISKAYFVMNMSDDLRKHLRQSVQPYPSDSELETKLRIISDWESYKTHVLNDYFVHKQKERVNIAV